MTNTSGIGLGDWSNFSTVSSYITLVTPNSAFDKTAGNNTARIEYGIGISALMASFLSGIGLSIGIHVTPAGLRVLSTFFHV
jgi:hypothetical protein